MDKTVPVESVESLLRTYFDGDEDGVNLPQLLGLVRSISAAPAATAQDTSTQSTDRQDVSINDAEIDRLAEQQDERAAFERWAKGACIRFDLGAWQGWQARAALTAPQDAQERDSQYAFAALQTIIDYPITGQRNMDVVNMKRIAINAFTTAQPVDKPEGKADRDAVLEEVAQAMDAKGGRMVNAAWVAETVRDMKGNAEQPKCSDGGLCGAGGYCGECKAEQQVEPVNEQRSK